MECKISPLTNWPEQGLSEISATVKTKVLFGSPLFEKFLISKHVLGQIIGYNNN